MNEKEILAKARTFNGLIKTIDDLFQHIERLQKCTLCKADFYDKFCPECSQNLKTTDNIRTDVRFA